MDPAALVQVRRFNRVVTERIGALDRRYLARDLTLGEARLLWEIGGAGCDLRELRARLGLDSGYLSRLVRALSRAGLVAVERSARDGRVRVARLTRAGAAERRLVDRLSDRLAASLLAPLDQAERARLLAAMKDVERLLTAAMVELRVLDPGQVDAQRCLRAYYAELDRRFEGGFDQARSIDTDPPELRRPRGLFLVAFLRGQPIGCGGLRLHARQPAEIKRVWVDGDVRGLGIGRRLLAALEAHAARLGTRAVRLDSNRALGEALALYRSAGYTEVPAFSDEPYAHHWFEKRLAGRPRSPRQPPRRGRARGAPGRR
jgi:DNA-binding MarR family transcriptional regulator/GNAT superfamily N-acetyltransferase